MAKKSCPRCEKGTLLDDGQEWRCISCGHTQSYESTMPLAARVVEAVAKNATPMTIKEIAEASGLAANQIRNLVGHVLQRVGRRPAPTGQPPGVYIVKEDTTRRYCECGRDITHLHNKITKCATCEKGKESMPVEPEPTANPTAEPETIAEPEPELTEDVLHSTSSAEDSSETDTAGQPPEAWAEMAAHYGIELEQSQQRLQHIDEEIEVVKGHRDRAVAMLHRLSLLRTHMSVSIAALVEIEADLLGPPPPKPTEEP